ncbi:MAG: hypothetical protein EOO75_18770, partial [Myxococcales bacterium]
MTKARARAWRVASSAATDARVAARSLETAAFPLAVVLATLATLASVAALDATRHARALAFVTGALWAGAAASHAVCFAMALAGVGYLLVRRGRAGAPATLGLGLGLAPSALLNHYRFGTWSPLSYGPIPWAHTNPELHKMTLGAQVGYALPLAAVLGLTVLGAWALRGRGPVQLALIGVAVAAVVLLPPLRDRALRYTMVTLGLLVDLDAVDMGDRYLRAADGAGTLFGRHVVKSVVQGTPLLALAPLALRGEGAERERDGALLVPPAALIATLITRGNLAYVDAIGWPWVSIRYALPMLPALCVASLVVVQRLRPGRRHVLGGSVLAVILLGWWWPMHGDDDWLKRAVLLRVGLVAAAALVVVAWRVQGRERGEAGMAFSRWL